MSQQYVIDLAREALYYVILIAAPMLGIGMIVGLAISIFQTTTSIQEQTLTFVPKLFVVFFSIVLFGPWMLRMLSDYIVRTIQRLPGLVY